EQFGNELDIDARHYASGRGRTANIDYLKITGSQSKNPIGPVREIYEFNVDVFLFKKSFIFCHPNTRHPWFDAGHAEPQFRSFDFICCREGRAAGEKKEHERENSKRTKQHSASFLFNY